jgi:hypothetical protein
MSCEGGGLYHAGELREACVLSVAGAGAGQPEQGPESEHRTYMSCKEGGARRGPCK